MDESRLGAIDHCYFCGKANTSVDKLIAGPGVAICDECVVKADFVLGHGKSSDMDVLAEGSGSRCSFCSLIGSPQASRNGIQICSECIALCIEIVTEEVDNTQTAHPSRDSSSKHPPLDLACSFCGRRKEESRQLIAGPDAYICDSCVREASSLPQPSDRSQHIWTVAKQGQAPAACSFCRRSAEVVKKMAYGPTACICDECLDLCLEIISEEIS